MMMMCMPFWQRLRAKFQQSVEAVQRGIQQLQYDAPVNNWCDCLSICLSVCLFAVYINLCNFTIQLQMVTMLYQQAPAS